MKRSKKRREVRREEKYEEKISLKEEAPETQRGSRDDLVWALTVHYGSPGRLADYRRQFEKTIRRHDIFAVALETLAVKAFRDMGNAARLRILRDHLIAGHASCELSRHLDSVAPETPIRDIVDRCPECGRVMLIRLIRWGRDPDLNGLSLSIWWTTWGRLGMTYLWRP